MHALTSPPVAGGPLALTSFIGREPELVELRGVLETTRMLTLTGAGGCGKTRLAAQLAHTVAGRFPDGVWWVDLAPVADERLVHAAIGEALGVRPLPRMTELQACARHLAPRRALLVLDNCEHLLEASAAVAAALLRAAPALVVLTTSRARLGVDGETAWRVPSLAGSDAAALFHERARHARPGFSLTDDAVARICDAADGLPLAIELAAARLRMLSAEQIAERMTDRFRLLTGGPRTATLRQRTLRASVDWSYELLSPEERVVLRRAAVFMGGFTLEAAEAVCGGDVLDVLGSLVDQSLVIAEPDVRYRLLETIRQYSLERLAESGEEPQVRTRHCHAFLAFAEAARFESAAQREWLDRFDPEAPNFAAAIDHALATDPALAFRFCAALHRWWRARGRLAEAELAYTRSLAACEDVEPALHARVLADRAFLVVNTGDYETAGVHAAEALALADEIGDLRTAAHARCYTGQAALLSTPWAARADLTRAAELARAAGDDWALVAAKQIATSSYFLQFDHARALSTNDEVAELADRIGDPLQRGRRWCWHAWPAMHDGRLEEALMALERGHELWKDICGPAQDGLVDYARGLIETWQGRPQAAIERLSAQLERALKHGAGFAVPWLLEGLAYAELGAGRPGAARGWLERLLDLLNGREGWSLSRALGLLAEAQRLLGDPGAESTALRAQAAGERLRNRFLETHARLTLARLAAARGDWAVAQQHALAHLDACAEGGHATHVPACLDALGESAGAPEVAARLLAAAESARGRLGTVRVPPEAEHWAAVQDELRSALGAEAYDAASAQGASLSTGDALEWARRGRGPRGRPASGWPSLTPTEVKVAELLCQGLTNPQIAERMFVSPGTVKTHVAHIFRKRDVHTRAELIALRHR